MKKLLIFFLVLTILNCSKREEQEKLNNFELLNIPDLTEKNLFLYQKRFGMGGSIYIDIYLSENCDGPLKNDLKFTHELFLEINNDTVTFYLPSKLYEKTLDFSVQSEKGVVFKKIPRNLTLYDRYQEEENLMLIDGYSVDTIPYCTK